jgi:hypothetical protein
MASFAPYNGRQDSFPSDPFKPQICIQGKSFPGERNQGFVFQGFNAFCSPQLHNVPNVPTSFYIIPLEEAYKLYIEPRLDKNWNLVKRSRQFLIPNEINNKAFNIHSGNDEIYASPLDEPNRCISDFCKQKM